MDTNQSRVLRCLTAKRDVSSVPEMAATLKLEKKHVRNAIDGLRRKHGKEFILNEPRGSTYFRLAK